MRLSKQTTSGRHAADSVFSWNVGMHSLRLALTAEAIKSVIG